ncbi:MAG: hypothetical protein ACE5K1_08185 [Acidiferrobacterales bacterium]
MTKLEGEIARPTGEAGDVLTTIPKRDRVGNAVYGVLAVVGWIFFLYSVAEFGLFARVLQTPYISSSGYEELGKAIFACVTGLAIVAVSNFYLIRRRCWPVLVASWVVCIAFLILAALLVYFLVFVLRL